MATHVRQQYDPIEYLHRCRGYSTNWPSLRLPTRAPFNLEIGLPSSRIAGKDAGLVSALSSGRSV